MTQQPCSKSRLQAKYILPQSENLNPIFHTRGIPYVIVPAGMGFKFSDGVSSYFGFLIIKKEVDSRRLFPLNIEPSRAMGMLPCHCLKKSAGEKNLCYLTTPFSFLQLFLCSEFFSFSPCMTRRQKFYFLSQT